MPKWLPDEKAHRAAIRSIGVAACCGSRSSAVAADFVAAGDVFEVVDELNGVE